MVGKIRLLFYELGFWISLNRCVDVAQFNGMGLSAHEKKQRLVRGPMNAGGSAIESGDW